MVRLWLRGAGAASSDIQSIGPWFRGATGKPGPPRRKRARTAPPHWPLRAASNAGDTSALSRVADRVLHLNVSGRACTHDTVHKRARSRAWWRFAWAWLWHGARTHLLRSRRQTLGPPLRRPPLPAVQASGESAAQPCATRAGSLGAYALESVRACLSNFHIGRLHEVLPHGQRQLRLAVPLALLSNVERHYVQIRL